MLNEQGSKKRLRICHVLWSVETGGAERVVLDLARAQKASGHDVSVLTLGDTNGSMAHEFRDVVDVLDAVPKRAKGIDVTMPFRVAKWFRAHRIEVVHTHNELPLIYAAPGGKLARAIVVHSKHGAVGVSRGAHLLRRGAATATDLFVAVSVATADVARTRGECAPHKLRVVINGTNLARFPAGADARAKIRVELGIPVDAQVIIAIGRLVKEKNHALLLRAASPLLDSKHHLVIAGDGPLRDDVHKVAREIPNAQYTHLTGGRSDVPDLLAAADVWALSSDTEGLPIALVEAWAAGLPVIATSVGGIPAAVKNEVTGILIPPTDEDALRVALTRALDPNERDRMRAMGERGRAHALGAYSSEQMARTYVDLYEAVLNGDT